MKNEEDANCLLNMSGGGKSSMRQITVETVRKYKKDSRAQKQFGICMTVRLPQEIHELVTINHINFNQLSKTLLYTWLEKEAKANRLILPSNLKKRGAHP